MNQKVPSVSIFVPAYNAAATITGVLKRIPDTVWKQIRYIYLINDGSKDTTQQIIEDIAREYPYCKALHHQRNEGYGTTVKEGLNLCREDGCDYCVCLHADGQYPAEKIPDFIGVMERKRLDLLQGSRLASGTALSGGMPHYKYIAGKMLTVLENRIFGMNMTDYHSGFIIYSNRFIHLVPFERLSGSFDIDLELIASARANRFSVGEQPIPTRYAEEVSYLNPVGYGIRVLLVLIKFIAGRYGIHAE
jgi:glycosyltransferase involved in cell wall biosynthesis